MKKIILLLIFISIVVINSSNLFALATVSTCAQIETDRIQKVAEQLMRKRDVESLKQKIEKLRENVKKLFSDDGIVEFIPEHTASRVCCPISLGLMKDPVKAEDKKIYDRVSIEKWFGSLSKKKSPLNGDEIGKTFISQPYILELIDSITIDTKKKFFKKHIKYVNRILELKEVSLLSTTLELLNKAIGLGCRIEDKERAKILELKNKIFLNIPREVFLQEIRKLSNEELLEITSISSRIEGFEDKNEIWQKLYFNNFAGIEEKYTEIRKNEIDWKDRFIRKVTGEKFSEEENPAQPQEPVMDSVSYEEQLSDIVQEPEFSEALSLEGHSDAVISVIKLGENRIVSASGDKTLRVWDTETGGCLHILRGHTASVMSVIKLEENRVVSASNDKTLRVWDTETGVCLKILEGHTRYISSVIKLEENRVVSASWDGTLRVWDTERGVCLKILEGQTGYVMSVIKLGENRVVSASIDGTLRVWDTERGVCLKTLEGHTDLVLSVIKLGENRVVSASEDKTLRVWNTETGECLKILEGHTDDVNSVIKLEENRVVSASLDGTLRVWNTETGVCLKILEGHTRGVSSVIKLGENRVVSASMDKTLRVWNTETGECLKILEGHTRWVSSVIELGENRIVSASADRTLKVWSRELPQDMDSEIGNSEVLMSA
jgi:WD40 repeat protein